MRISNNKYFVLGMLVMPLCLLTLGAAFASSTSTPNTFVQNTPALASQVNANFAAHRAAINDNDARIDALRAPVVNGIAKAMVHVRANGTVSRSFNSLGGAATVTHSGGSSAYVVRFPGVSMNSRFFVATPGRSAAGQGTSEGFVSVQPSVTDNNALYVITKTGTFNFGERDFYLVIY